MTTPTAVLFPGQGSLTPDSADQARDAWPELVELATELTGDDPFGRAQDSTAYAQPAIYAASLAGWREHREAPSNVVAMAGHSLGELSALAAAGAVAVDEGLRLVVLRGRLMADAAARADSDGGMLALLGGTPEAAAELARERGLTVANDNAPGQVVLSGERTAIKGLAADARSEGFKSLVLDVAGAFHSPAIASAEAPFRAALREVEWKAPSVPVVSGLTAEPFSDIPAELARALVSPVRWREVMTTLFDLGARDFVDVGPGRVLARLVPRNLPELETHAAAH
jgi:malonyl CoA-acyl carrier protein transacylase